MKKKFTLYLLFFLIMFIPFMGNTQDWGGEKPHGFFDHWSVNANVGLTSYFGDLSYHDTDIAGKINYESGLAAGVLLTKHINKIFAVSGQLLYGNMEGGDNQKVIFKSELLEYNLQARVDLIRVFMGDRNPKFGIEAYGGVGQMIFETTQTLPNEGSPVTKTHQTRVPEFVYHAGMGLHYHFSEDFAVTASMSIRQLRNDKLDGLVKNENFDYYSYTSIGITYYLNSLKRTPLKNKARVAHTGVRSAR
jgi:hypothetical protein